MKKITNKTMINFAIGQLGWSILSGIVTSWLVYFYILDPTTEELGQIAFIPQGNILFFGLLSVIGLITAISRIFDAVSDPLVAGWSDGLKNKSGRRIPFMKWSAIPFAICTVCIFLNPVQGISGWNVAWLAFFVILFYFFMTCYCTPYNALIPELGRNQKDRINISTYISMTYIVGTGIAYLASSIWPLFINMGLGRMDAIRLTFGIMAFIAIICMLVPVFTIKESDYYEVKPVQSNPFKSLAKTFKNKQFRIFVTSDVFYWIAITIFQTGLTKYLTVLLNLEESMSGVIFIAMTLISFCFYIPVNILAKKIGKKPLVFFAFVFFAITFVFSSFSGIIPINTTVYAFIIAFLAAVSMAILGILPQAMVADIAESDAKETGEKREGMFMAARTFAFKLGQSIAILMFASFSYIDPASGMGYRIALYVAAGFAILGAVALHFYDEKKVLSTISEEEATVKNIEEK